MQEVTNNNRKGNLRLVKPGRTRAAAPSAVTAAVATAAPGSGAADEYTNRIMDYAERIRSTQDLPAIIAILDEALRETRALHGVEALSHAERQVAKAERRIAALKDELETVNALLRTDALTGALNRRGLDEAFSREAARADRRGAKLAVALIDLDNFKRLNDSHGHDAGDAALARVAEVTRRTLRPQDLVARFGGEEFVILFTDTDLEAGLAAMARLHGALAEAPPERSGRRLQITFSGGITSRRATESLEQALSRADEALYRAKHAGKNRTYPA